MLPADDLFQPAAEEEILHRRDYVVRSFRQSPDRLRIRGMVHDQKPPGVYIDDDPDPLSVHQMVVDLIIEFPSLEIVGAEVVMEVTPHTGCTSIEPNYSDLVGLSIARGFSRQVKDLFGGPRGCTHVGALLQAMAPVAIQSSWSMRAMNEGETAVSLGGGSAQEADAAEARRQALLTFNMNTCHVWSEDGTLIKQALAGEEIEAPIWAVDRLLELGRSVDDWHKRE